VTVFTGKVEFGQNARTSLAQAVAEELRSPLSTIRLVMGDTDLTPFDMGTFGSRSTPYMAPQLRKAAAVARELLKELAATQWSVDPSALEVEGGEVRHSPTSRTIGFGALTKGQKLVRTIAGEVATTPADRWTIAGHSATKVNAREIVTGRHRYTSDLGPGPFAPSELLHGKVLRPPAMGADARVGRAGQHREPRRRRGRHGRRLRRHRREERGRGCARPRVAQAQLEPDAAAGRPRAPRQAAAAARRPARRPGRRALRRRLGAGRTRESGASARGHLHGRLHRARPARAARRRGAVEGRPPHGLDGHAASVRA
jgi:hypothetical protein